MATVDTEQGSDVKLKADLDPEVEEDTQGVVSGQAGAEKKKKRRKKKKPGKLL